MTIPRPPQLQINNTLINIFFNPIITYTTLFVLFTYFFNYLSWYIFFLSTYIVNYNVSILFTIILSFFTVSTYTENFQHKNNVEYSYCRKNFKHPRSRTNPSSGPTRFQRRKQVETHKKTGERFHPGGQVSMRQKRAGTAIVPRSNVHIHTVTLGESMNHKDYRRKDRDQPEERKDQQDALEEKRQGFTARKKRDSTQVARCL